MSTDSDWVLFHIGSPPSLNREIWFSPFFIIFPEFQPCLCYYPNKSVEIKYLLANRRVCATEIKRDVESLKG